MNMPGFTAQVSLGASTHTYVGKYLYSTLYQAGPPEGVVPSQLERVGETVEVFEAAREVREACRQVRICRRECRDTFQDCREDCRESFGRGRDFRKCRRDCREQRRECREDCRDEFLTPECRRARWRLARRVLTLGVDVLRERLDEDEDDE